MSITLYQKMKARYLRTKPIRGRAVDTRPWSNRRRDWELAVESNGCYGAEYAHSAKVLVHPNGDIQFNMGAWSTPATAEFANQVFWDEDFKGEQHFTVSKTYGRLWVCPNGLGDGHPDYFCIVLSTNTSQFIRWDESGKRYIPPPKTKILKRGIDGVAAKKARAMLKPFKAYVTAQLEKDDGWVRNMDKYTTRATYYVVQKLDGYEYKDWDIRSVTGATYNDDALRIRLFNCMVQDRGGDWFDKVMYVWLAGCTYEANRYRNKHGYLTEFRQNLGEDRSTIERQFILKTVIAKMDDFAVFATHAYKFTPTEVDKPTKGALA